MEKKNRTITLTGRPPVRISEENWPRIASGWDAWHDGEVECQANRTMDVRINVRQHADGRTLIYGVYRYRSNWQHEPDHTFHAGYLVAATGGDLPALISRVGRELADQADQADHEPPVANVFRRVAAECVAALPAEDLG